MSLYSMDFSKRLKEPNILWSLWMMHLLLKGVQGLMWYIQQQLLRISTRTLVVEWPVSGIMFGQCQFQYMYSPGLQPWVLISWPTENIFCFIYQMVSFAQTHICSPLSLCTYFGFPPIALISMTLLFHIRTKHFNTFFLPGFKLFTGVRKPMCRCWHTCTCMWMCYSNTFSSINSLSVTYFDTSAITEYS